MGCNCCHVTYPFCNADRWLTPVSCSVASQDPICTPRTNRYHTCGIRRYFTSLKLSQFVERRRWWPYAREGIAETSVLAGDEPCQGEAIRDATARFNALQ